MRSDSAPYATAPHATDPSALEAIRARPGDRRRLLFTNATVVTMDPEIGVLDHGEVLVEADTIRAVGSRLEAGDDALVIDVAGCVLVPGFVDTHRHAWQSPLRRIMPDVNDLSSYVTATLAGHAPAYGPEDMYVGTLLTALSAIDSGVTCLLDFSHNARSAAHSDAAVQALADSGIRGVHASMAPHFGSWDGQWPQDLGRLRERCSGPLLTLRLAALATDEIAGPALAYGPELAGVARELDIGVSVDAVFGAASTRAVRDWYGQGLLGPQVTLIHATGLGAEAWEVIGETGTTVSLAPTSDAQIGLETAIPAVDEALAAGVRPGLSVDVEVALAGDMFTQLRTLHTVQRMRAANDAYGTGRAPARIGVHDVLDFATLQGARTNGLDGVTGSITPGKKADLLVVSAEEINNMPLNDPVGTVVLGSDARNVVAVLINGEPRKWAGRVLDIDLTALRTRVHDSRARILGRDRRRARHDDARKDLLVNDVTDVTDMRDRKDVNDVTGVTGVNAATPVDPRSADRPRRDPAVLADLADPRGRPLLLTGGTVLTENALMGDWQQADVLIGGDVIVGVGPGLLTAAEDDGMIVIDCAGTVVLPASLDRTGEGQGGGGGGTLTPGERADIAVFRIADAPDAPLATGPARDSHLDLVVIGGRVRFWDGRTTTAGPAPETSVEPPHDTHHPYVGSWVTDDRFLRQELLPDGRYDEARGDRESAYQGRYWVTGNRIDYLDDLGFWAYGEFHDGTLDHAGYRLTRR